MQHTLTLCHKCQFIYIFKIIIILFLQSWSSLLHGLPLNSRAGPTLQFWCPGFSLWLSCCGAQAPGHTGFSSCNTWTQQLWHAGLQGRVPNSFSTGASCSMTCGILPRVRGLNLCLLHWQAESLSLSHQGSPKCHFK